MTKVSPSILSADFAELIRDINDIKNGGANYMHLDIMDGQFVPNITFGPPVVKSIRKATDMIFDTHLMVDRPHRFVKAFCEAGADIVVFHVEADKHDDILSAIDIIKSCGKKAGLALRPVTPASSIEPYINLLDMVLVMTVEPGFGGQSFMPEQLSKIAEIRKVINERGLSCELEVDGGIDAETAALCREAGADVLVAGSAIIGAADRAAVISAIRG